MIYLVTHIHTIRVVYFPHQNTLDIITSKSQQTSVISSTGYQIIYVLPTGLY